MSRENAHRAANKIAENRTRQHFAEVDATTPPLELSKAKVLLNPGDPEFDRWQTNEVGWDSKKDGKCNLLQPFGVYWGLPGKFTVNAKAEGGNLIKAREYVPYTSFGLIVAPVAAFSFMVGLTASHVEDDSEKPLNQNVWSWNFGVGGNLDLAGALLK